MNSESPVPVPERLRGLRVVLCHDWLTGMRGGERVLEILCRVFPDAPIYTLVHNRGAITETINRHSIRTSFLQRIPAITQTYRNFLPLFPAAIDGLRLPPCDLVISTSHCVAKAIQPPAGARHLCYCFTPMRYIWVFYREYFGANPLKKIGLMPFLAYLRGWDRRTTRRVHRFAAISRHIQARIHDCYGRDADLIYPPVDVGRWSPSPDAAAPEDFDLIVSALTPYKRIDLAIDAYNRMGRRLKIVGVGGECCRLHPLAGPTVELLGWQTDAVVLDLYRRCTALVFPGEEDFGLVPLEAQACGKPVIAYARGGALETVRDGITGVFFQHQATEELMQAVEECHRRTWNPAAIRSHAEQFSVDHFLAGLTRSIESCLA